MVSSIDFGADSNRFDKFINRIKNLSSITRMFKQNLDVLSEGRSS